MALPLAVLVLAFVGVPAGILHCPMALLLAVLPAHSRENLRGSGASQALRRRKEEADALAREVEAYERMCRDEDEEYKADVKRRYEVLARGLKKVADQEQQASKEAKKRQEQLEEALKGA